MMIAELLSERIHTHDLFDQAYAAIMYELTRVPEAADPLREIKGRLSVIASNYAAQWKSGVKNMRGYELPRMEIELKVIQKNWTSNNFDGGYTTKDFHDGGKYAVIEMNVPDVNELLFKMSPADRVTERELLESIANMMAEIFAHEMQHYRQEITSKVLFNRTKYMNARRANARPMSNDQLNNMSDADYTAYRSTRHEVDAHAGNAARELMRAFNGAEIALKYLHNDPAVIASHSSTYAKMVRDVREKRPKAWRRFLTQLTWSLTALVKKNKPDAYQ